MTGGFLALALLAPAQPPAPGAPQKGTEFTFAGTVDEGIDRPGKRFRRSQALEVRVLILESGDRWADVAVLTLLRRTEDAVAGGVGALTGAAPADKTPPLARLDLVRVHADGAVHHLHPTGPPPLALDAKTQARALPPVPLDTFSHFEFGMFAPKPPRSDPDKPWTVASADPNRPPEVWQVQGADFVTAERCALLVMNQQHPNWDKPVGGKSAWQRADAVWVSAADGVARKVHKVIRHRDGLATDPALWVEVKYQLTEQTRVIGRAFDRYRRDIDTAFAFGAELAPFFADAVKHGPKFFDTKAAKLDAYLEGSDASSPYREAVLAVRRQLDAARRGESVSAVPLTPAVAARPTWPEAGRAAPDFSAGEFRLSEARGKPVVLVFFKPGVETTPEALQIADALHQKYGSRVAVVPLAVAGERVAGQTERDRLKLTVPIYDGTQADAAYGPETVPRFLVIDGQGIVRWSFAGVGNETGATVKRQLERLLPPGSPAGGTGTAGTPGPGTAVPPRQP